MDGILHVDLLGPGALHAGPDVLRARSGKTLALLARLALAHDRPHARDGLAALLWPAHGEAAARQSLRQALHALRTLGGGQLAPCLVVDADLVRFVPSPSAAVDVHRFEAAASSLDVGHWREAADAYRAPLLDGRSIGDAPAFEDWLASERERLHSIAVHNVDRLASESAARGDAEGAMRHALRMRGLDPAGEIASRHLMRALAARHDAGGLAAEWARLCEVLERELGTVPTDRTAALHRALREGLCADERISQRIGVTAAPTDSGDARDVPGERDSAGERRTSGIAAADSLLRAAHAAGRLHAFGPALDLCERALAVLRDDDGSRPAPDDDAAMRRSARRGDALMLKEGLLDRLGRRAEQVATIDELLAHARACGDPALRAAALLRRANACAYLGEHDRARDAARDALHAFRALGDRPGEAEALRESGFAAWRAGRFDEALAHGRAALAAHRALGDVAGEASALHNLAELHRELGSPRRALEGYEQALALHWSASSTVGELMSRFGIANARLQIGDAAGARREHEAALALAERCGERTMQSRALQALATASLEAGDIDGALRSMRLAIDVDRAINYAHALGHDLVQLAWIHLRRGERLDARAALHEALVWFDYTQDAAASAAVTAYCDELDAGRDPVARGRPGERVASHVPLAEGKVYCAFESVVGR